MRKLFVLIPLVLFIIASSTFADSRSESHFPMDDEMAWIYDDGTIEKIVGFKKLTFEPQAVQQGKELNAHLFVFDSYNNEQRTFFVVGDKIFEWTENNQRLRYDFSGKVGDKWKMQWGKINLIASNRRDPLLADINEGAEMTLLEKGIKVETPLGEFGDCYHFRLTRPDVSESVYIDEWFAPGVGCVMREVSNPAGIRRQKLVRVERHEQIENKYRMDIRLNKEVYHEGEEIVIEVSVLNWSDRDITLDFPSSLQVDYEINDVYRYSENHEFIQAETQITIPARDVQKWEFIHTPDDFLVPYGKHIIIARLAGTEFATRQELTIYRDMAPLPVGITLSAETTKQTYNLGEPVELSLTVNNNAEAEVSLDIVEEFPLWYSIERIVRFPDPFAELPEPSPVVIPGKGSVAYNGVINADIIFLKPGDYTLRVGLSNNVDAAEVEFAVSRDVKFGELVGTVFTPVDEENLNPLTGAQIMLKLAIPDKLRNELEDVYIAVENLWAGISGEDGGFILPNIPVGDYFTLDVRKEGFFPYSRTIRMLSELTEIKIVLKPEGELPENPMNFRKRESRTLLVSFGTGKSVYNPNSPFKAFMKVTNTSQETVSLTFDSEDYLDTVIKSANDEIIWSSPEGTEKTVGTAEYIVEIPPGETEKFMREGTFEGKVPEHGGKYIIEGILRVKSSSIEDLSEEDVKGVVRVLIVPEESKRIEAKAHKKQLMVDLKEEVKTTLDMTMKEDDIEGELNICEIRENFHKPRQKERFVKMVEVDADETIRNGMEEAVIRIYYDLEDFAEDFDPDKLSIAHWQENVSLEIEDEPDWEELESRVDTVNQFVEASTTTFSSFGLFETEESTGVAEDESVPKEFMLKQNYPNPFNPTTVIQFHIPEAGSVRLTVYNIVGQEVVRLVDGNLSAGIHQTVFNGSNQSSGVFFYRIEAPGFTKTRKMLLIK